jgi:hypothetical protein
MLIVAAALVAAPGGPSGIWIGQDGHDLVGPSCEPKPSGVQDIHIVLDGLPPARGVVHAIITGHGADEWQFQGKWGPWAAVLERAPASRRGDLFLEPTRVETGRPFTVKLRFDDGSTSEFVVRGRRANPRVRMPGAALTVTWIGQKSDDWVGSGLGVGPDGLQDARLELRGLSPGIEVRSVLIEGPAGIRWRFGVNADGDANAELVRDRKEQARADLYFQPTGDLSGQRLRLTLVYALGQTDVASVVAGPTDPARRMPAVKLPEPIAHTITARWLGQDRSPGARPGDVHVAISGIPLGRSIAAAALSDSVRGGYWVYRSSPGNPAVIAPVDEEAPLTLRAGKGPESADFFFAPIRDETEAMLTLRLVMSDGALALVRFPGGTCDPRLRVPEVAGTTCEARPGDDLHELVNRHRTVKLAPGTYRLRHPLVLDQPVALLGAPGATLLFDQATDQPPWPAAITVHRGRTTLEGFAVRFAGPIRWKNDVSWGPALIGVTEVPDNSHPDPRIGMTFTRLDLEAPPAANPGGWVEAPRTFRLVNARGGRVANNRIKGGTIELSEGPWEIAENDYQGTAPGTVSPSVIAAHFCHDLVVKRNRAQPVGPSGKTWRFLVLTGSGTNDRIEDNVVTAIGPRDDDTIPPANAPEVVLTEAYHLHFEGRPASIAPDGRIVGLGQGQPLGYPAMPGSVVAVLSGGEPGQWRRITHVLDRVTFLLDEPLPPGTDRIAVATGFVNETFARNVIDSRGGSKAGNLILAGNHFGTRVVDNHLKGAGDAFLLTAYPTESPGIWGWSHAPFLGGLIAGNTLEDAQRGGTIGVVHSEYAKSNHGRTYLTATLRENTVKWTSGFLHERRRAGTTVPPPALTIGIRPSRDPGELVVATRHNRLDAPPGLSSAVTVRVNAAILNGRRTVDQAFTLTPVQPAANAASGPLGASRR